MYSDNLTVFVDAIAVFCSKLVSVGILSRDGVAALLIVLCINELAQISVIIIVQDLAFLCGLTVMYRRLDHRLDNAHAGYDSLNGDQLVDKVCPQAAWRNVIPAEVSIKIDIVLFNFCGECFVVCLGRGFFITTFETVVFEVLNSVVQLILKHVESV